MTGKTRYHLLDDIRGIAILSVILYHVLWDLEYLFGHDIPWFESWGTNLWEFLGSSIFILLSGFCWNLGKQHLKRGGIVFGGGALITIVTMLFMPDDRVIFGVLTLLGTCMIMMCLINPLFERFSPNLGFIITLILYLVFLHMNDGYIGIGEHALFDLPKQLYQGIGMTFLGFPDATFYSSDYFPLFPYLFLFLAGYFLYHMAVDDRWIGRLEAGGVRWLEWIGRHTLWIYMLHQPVIYGILILLQ